MAFGRRGPIRELALDVRDHDGDDLDRALDDAVDALAARGVELDVSIPGLFTAGPERVLQFRAADADEVMAELERHVVLIAENCGAGLEAASDLTAGEGDSSPDERPSERDHRGASRDDRDEWVELDLDEVPVVDVQVLGAQLVTEGIDVEVHADGDDDELVRPCRIIYPTSDEDAVLDALTAAGLISPLDRDLLATPEASELA